MDEKLDTEQGNDLKVYRPRSKVPIIVIVTLAVCLFISTILFIVFVSLYASSSNSSSSSTSDVCQTKSCYILAGQIRGAMDETVDPCEDFYNYTCGNWGAFNHVTSGTGVLRELQLNTYSDLARIIEERDFTGGNAILTQLSNYYDSCTTALLMDDTAFEDTFIPVIRQIYQDLGGWSLVGIPGDNTPWNINSSQFIKQKQLGGGAFYSISMNSPHNYYVPGIVPSGLTLNHPNNYVINSTNYDYLVRTISYHFNVLAKQQVSMDAIIQIVDFEFSLAEIWQEKYNSSIYTVQDLYDVMPNHDWFNVLQGIFEPSGVNILPTSEVVFWDAAYFRRLSSLVESTSIEVLENYAKWSLTWKASEAFHGISSIRKMYFELKQSIWGEPSMDQQQECVKLVNKTLPIALARVYAEHLLPPGSKEAAEEMVAEVRKALAQRMMELDWLDSETRRLALEKLDAIEARIAYPPKTFDDTYLNSLYGEYDLVKTKFVDNYFQSLKTSEKYRLADAYKSVDIQRDRWTESIVSANAFYHDTLNQITIMEGIMRAPFFNTDSPLSMQYGALGTVIGHELTHGFDNNGRQYDKDGEKRMWWSQPVIDTFNERTQCFVDQYSQYGLYGANVNGTLTLPENLADNGGIRASFKAFKEVSRKSQSLPGLTDFTENQLFFIAFSQVWCTYNTESYYLSGLDDVHTPSPIRAIGTLSNNEAFAEAFNCPNTASMNPPKKCVLW